MEIVSSNIINTLEKSNGRVRITEELTDDVGNTHVIRYMLKDNLPSTLAEAQALRHSRFTSRTVEKEQKDYLNSILNGQNKFAEGDPVYTSRVEMISLILDHIMNAEDPFSIIKALGVFDALTDEELKAIKGYSQIQVDSLRTRVNLILSGISDYIKGVDLL